MAKWIEFVYSKSELELVEIALDVMHQLIGTKSIHTVIADLEDKAFILSTYYAVQHVNPKKQISALLESQRAIKYAMFGGQGPNEEYLIELQSLYDHYTVFFKDILPICEKVTGLPLSRWLHGEHPPFTLSTSVPVSLPLIGFTQLAQYYITSKVLQVSPGELRDKFNGVAGHSQGIISAIAISVSDTEESFFINLAKSLRFLKALGSKAQQVFPKVYLESSMVQDCIEEGYPTAMLSILGAEEAFLKEQIELVNKHLDRQIAISLYNGPKNFVITGPPRSLYGLVLTLRKLKVGSDVEQSKIPFSKRKPIFNMRFLPVDVPFHSSYLEICTDLVLEDLSDVDFWKSSDLKIPVYHTETGEDMRSLTSDFTKSLCDQILTKPIYWQKVVAFSPSATHIIDFGPGGTIGIGPMTSRNLDGTGVVCVTLGSNFELYDSLKFKMMKPWSETWSPSLIKKRYVLIN
jgi:malonyl CoA-acyl carrier protein transacylase